MRAFILVLGSLLTASAAFASDDESGAVVTSIRPFIGAYLPTGAEHRELSRAVLAGAQLGYDLPAPVRLVGSIAWTPTRERDFGDRRSNVYQYDAGLEVARREMPGDQWSLSPFAGAGLGARSYRFKGVTTADQTDFDGYGSVGGEVARNRLGARVEVRDYLSRFKEVTDLKQHSTRNDVMIAGVVTFHL